jgi:hypothetical protein
VIVNAGTYVEDVAINNAGLQLLGAARGFNHDQRGEETVRAARFRFSQATLPSPVSRSRVRGTISLIGMTRTAF